MSGEQKNFNSVLEQLENLKSGHEQGLEVLLARQSKVTEELKNFIKKYQFDKSNELSRSLIQNIQEINQNCQKNVQIYDKIMSAIQHASDSNKSKELPQSNEVKSQEVNQKQPSINKSEIDEELIYKPKFERDTYLKDYIEKNQKVRLERDDNEADKVEKKRYSIDSKDNYDGQNELSPNSKKHLQLSNTHLLEGILCQQKKQKYFNQAQFYYPLKFIFILKYQIYIYINRVNDLILNSGCIVLNFRHLLHYYLLIL